MSHPAPWENAGPAPPDQPPAPFDVGGSPPSQLVDASQVVTRRQLAAHITCAPGRGCAICDGYRAQLLDHEAGQ